MGRTLFVGIDIGADTNVVRIIDDTGDDVCGFTVSNDLPGTERLVEKVGKPPTFTGGICPRPFMMTLN